MVVRCDYTKVQLVDYGTVAILIGVTVTLPNLSKVHGSRSRNCRNPS